LSEHPKTEPSSELPDVDPDAAQPIVIPGPPGLPKIDETTEPPASLPRDAPTPQTRLRKDVADMLHQAEEFTKEPARHASSEPVDVVDALRSLVSQLDGKQSKRLADHEAHEREIAKDLAAKVEAVEGRAAEERAALSDKIDRLAMVLDELPVSFKEAASSIADRFLEPIGTLIKELADLKEVVQEHSFKLRKLDKLSLEQLVDRVQKLERELAEVKQLITNLTPRSVDAT
jgi:DNA anti-recombination protein RmuC